MPDPTGRRRVPASGPSFPQGAALVAELKRIAAAHPLSDSDMVHIAKRVETWRRAVLDSLGPASTGDADAADAPPGDPTGGTSS